MSSLVALLPAADPHAPFQMAEYLRNSQVRDPLAAEADLAKSSLCWAVKLRLRNSPRLANLWQVP